MYLWGASSNGDDGSDVSNDGGDGDDGGDVNNADGDGDTCVIDHDGDDVDRRFSPSLGGVLVIPLKDLMWATAILQDVLSIRVVRFCSISHFPLDHLIK